MTNKTTTQLKLDIADYLPDNVNREISPEDVRQRMLDIVDSMAYPTITSSGSTGGDAPSFNVDLDYPIQILTASGDITSWSVSNQSQTAHKPVKLKIRATTGLLFTFPSDWGWLGPSPSGMITNEKILLSVASFGSGVDDVICAFETIGSGV